MFRDGRWRREPQADCTGIVILIGNRNRTRMNILIRSFIAWLLAVGIILTFIATRDTLLAPVFGEEITLWIGTLAVCTLVLAIGWSILRGLRLGHTLAIGMGYVWVRRALVTEFLMRQFVFGHPWELFLADYNIFALRPWALVPLTVFAVPVIMTRRVVEIRFPDAGQFSIPQNRGEKPSTSDPSPVWPR